MEDANDTTGKLTIAPVLSILVASKKSSDLSAPTPVGRASTAGPIPSIFTSVSPSAAKAAASSGSILSPKSPWDEDPNVPDIFKV